MLHIQTFADIGLGWLLVGVEVAVALVYRNS